MTNWHSHCPVCNAEIGRRKCVPGLLPDCASLRWRRPPQPRNATPQPVGRIRPKAVIRRLILTLFWLARQPADYASLRSARPTTVREKLAEYQDLAGFNTSLTKTQFGALPDDMTRANMTANRGGRFCRRSAEGCRRGKREVQAAE